jgi:hypothetical protein
MAKALEQAIEQITALPDSDQEQIGRQLLTYVEKLRGLREKLDAGVASLDAGEGRHFDVGEFIRQK